MSQELNTVSKYELTNVEQMEFSVTPGFGRCLSINTAHRRQSRDSCTLARSHNSSVTLGRPS